MVKKLPNYLGRFSYIFMHFTRTFHIANSTSHFLKSDLLTYTIKKHTSVSLTQPSYLYQAKVSIPTVVITPPKHPNLSHKMVSAPDRAELMAALNPLGPPPTTKTSHLASRGTFFSVSVSKLSLRIPRLELY